MKETLIKCLETAVDSLLADSEVDAEFSVQLTRTKQREHGDFNTNLAMMLAKPFGRSPRNLADAIVSKAEWPSEVEKTEIAGPGFINIFLKSDLVDRALRQMIQQGEKYGLGDRKDQTVCLEFVSANPTGPMHVGHGRGAVVGDVLARILLSQGVAVQKEYYINDAGNQIKVLVDSVWWRMCELEGGSAIQPEESYPAEYVVDIAKSILKETDFETCQSLAIEDRRALLGALAVDMMMDRIRLDLKGLGISFDHFFSEKSMHDSGIVTRLIDTLKEQGKVYYGVLPPPKGKVVEDYIAEEQWLFRATEYGDDNDRPLMKSDGSATYFAADIAYHADKHARKFDRQINVWGADHGGYVKRVQSALSAVCGTESQPEVILVQMVNLTRDGKPVRMSKRAGTFVTLTEVVQEIGADAFRFNILTRRSESQFDFDLELAKQKSEDNPVFYVQYAHARACAVIRKVQDEEARSLDLSNLEDVALPDEEEARALAQKLLQYPDVLAQSGMHLEPHRLVSYLMQLAAGFHRYYHQYRVIGSSLDLAQSRLFLIHATRQVIANGLGVLGVSAPESM